MSGARSKKRIFRIKMALSLRPSRAQPTIRNSFLKKQSPVDILLGIKDVILAVSKIRGFKEWSHDYI